MTCHPSRCAKESSCLIFHNRTEWHCTGWVVTDLSQVSNVCGINCARLRCIPVRMDQMIHKTNIHVQRCNEVAKNYPAIWSNRRFCICNAGKSDDMICMSWLGRIVLLGVFELCHPLVDLILGQQIPPKTICILHWNFCWCNTFRRQKSGQISNLQLGAWLGTYRQFENVMWSIWECCNYSLCKHESRVNSSRTHPRRLHYQGVIVHIFFSVRIKYVL